MNGARNGFISEITYSFLPEQYFTVKSADVEFPTLRVLSMGYDVVGDAAAIHYGFVVVGAFHPALRSFRMEIVLR